MIDALLTNNMHQFCHPFLRRWVSVPLGTHYTSQVVRYVEVSFHRLDPSLVPTLQGCSISAPFISQLVEASYQPLWRGALRQSVSLISEALLVSALSSAKTLLIVLPLFFQITRKSTNRSC